MRPGLPPLNALKAFEAAARLGSFGKAAAALGVTPAAVGQQVRHLEARLGRRLFERGPGGVVLTDAGRTVLPAVIEGFDRLAEVALLSRPGPVPRRLVVSASPSLAVGWLSSLAGRVGRNDPGFAVDLRAEEDPVDFQRDRIDLRICYGEGLYPDYPTEALLTDEVLPVCAPGFLARRGGKVTPEELEPADLIATDWGPGFASPPTWADWLAVRGVPAPAGTGHQAGMSSLAVEFAVQGMGIALGQRLLVRDLLADGRLVNPFGPALPLARPYCLVTPLRPGESEALTRFRERLCADARG